MYVGDVIKHPCPNFGGWNLIHLQSITLLLGWGMLTRYHAKLRSWHFFNQSYKYDYLGTLNPYGLTVGYIWPGISIIGTMTLLQSIIQIWLFGNFESIWSYCWLHLAWNINNRNYDCTRIMNPPRPVSITKQNKSKHKFYGMCSNCFSS